MLHQKKETTGKEPTQKPQTPKSCISHGLKALHIHRLLARPQSFYHHIMEGYSLHPGHVSLSASLPFCYWAYRGYHQRLPVPDFVISNNSKQAAVDEQARRRILGSTVAYRALRVATCGSIGVFGLVTAGFFYASGCTSLAMALDRTRTWAQEQRKGFDQVFGTRDRVDQEHPEYVAVRGMTEEQEMDYISQKYLPNEDWESSDDDSQSASITEK